jgi:hypothetical protein
MVLVTAYAGSDEGGRVLVSNSVRLAPATTISRAVLTDEELAATQDVQIQLGLRNVSELKERIVKGEIISPEEMRARFYPSHEIWAAVATWVTAQGLAVDPEGPVRMSVVAHGPRDRIASAFQTKFARVIDRIGHEQISAVALPSVPPEIGAYISGICGLEPQLPPRTFIIYQPIATLSFGPQYLLDHYGASGVGDGTGEIVAIWGYNKPPNMTDLTTYWTKIGSPHTSADVTIINPNGFSAYNDTPDGSYGPEITMDVELVSGLCPGAKIRVYCLQSYEQMLEAILADAPQFPGMHQLSISAGLIGGTTSTQSFMAVAAQGITTFASSGDGGSNPNAAQQGYDPTAPLSVSYPAADPYVTAVGGTQEAFGGLGPNASGPTTTGIQAEFAWTEGTIPAYSGITETLSSGGGISTFVRPSWQSGPGVPTGNLRCVPDVAAEAEGDQYVYIGRDGLAAGTSESAPIWAALCAILNQSMIGSGHPPVGLLGPKIYPLAGTGAMNYITQGFTTYELDGTPGFAAGTVDTNGAYAVGPTYDLITGLGVPNISLIAAALEAPPAGLSVSIISPLPAASVENGSSPILLSATATGAPTAYQWNLNGNPIPEAVGATLEVYPTAANQGRYTVVVTNSAGSASADAGVLSVTTDAWIANISARSYAETGSNLLIAGFVTTGPGSKSLLIRGIGPGLAPFNVTGFLPDPKLTLLNGVGTVLDSSISWSTSLQTTMSNVGAFNLVTGSHDAELLESLSSGQYTAQVVSSTTNLGVALAEIYDADATAPTNRLINISARAFVGSGANILIGGFVISGNGPETVVIRGDGPALSAFGLNTALTGTTLTLLSGSNTVATNSGWGNAPTNGPALTAGMVVQSGSGALFSKIGAFGLAEGSGDSVIVATLPPGAYTAQLEGTNGGTGVGLLEIYELR